VKQRTVLADSDSFSIAVVIPAYRVTRHIVDVVRSIPEMVNHIYVVDDCCPDGSGKLVEEKFSHGRIKVLYHEINMGVGGAVMTGYAAAQNDGCAVVVKVDGDGQMDPALLPYFVEPILTGEADYTKGNRFYNLEEIKAMPQVRLFGNAVLSFMAKFSTGYWNIFDPTNGYTAIHTDILRHLPLQKISRRYFFETDILFRLNTLKAVVVDVPMDAQYGNEVSNLHVQKVLGEFFVKHCRNCFKRIFYNYFLRDLSIASLELVAGLMMFLFGLCFGGYHWLKSAQLGIPSATGTVMLAAMPLLIGIQLLLAFVGYDISTVPRRPVHRRKFPVNRGQ